MALAEKDVCAKVQAETVDVSVSVPGVGVGVVLPIGVICCLGISGNCAPGVIQGSTYLKRQ